MNDKDAGEVLNMVGKALREIGVDVDQIPPMNWNDALRRKFGDIKEKLRLAEMDSANYRGECDTCGTPCMNMLTDNHCAECERRRLIEEDHKEYMRELEETAKQTVKYRVGKLIVDGNERRGEAVKIPQAIYDACWWDRLFFRNVAVYRVFEDGREQCVFFWPARKMQNPGAS